jgi:predicted NBD/HSP70 family sugar kinase/biotin operon repressor
MLNLHPVRISRTFSTSAVVQAIVTCAPISRASIAKQTGLSKQTVSEIMTQLEADGWVREIGRAKGRVGRTAITYELIPESAYVLGVDLGGTKVRAALIDLGGNVVAECNKPTHPEGGKAVVAQIAALCRGMIEKQRITLENVVFAVVGVPGVPDEKTGHILLAPNIEELNEINLVADLSRALGIETKVMNDVNLAALGESWIGCGTDVEDLAFISLGTGIGAGLIIGGNLVRGAKGAAGELGYLPFGADPFEMESLKTGAFERRAGSFGMIARYKELTGNDISVPALFDAVNAGDEKAVEVIEETARLLARMIAALGATVNPALIILGGSIGMRPELMPPIRAALAACFPFPVELAHSQLGSHAALVGAASVGLEHLHQRLFAQGAAGVEIVVPKLKAPDWKGAA